MFHGSSWVPLDASGSYSGSSDILAGPDQRVPDRSRLFNNFFLASGLLDLHDEDAPVPQPTTCTLDHCMVSVWWLVASVLDYHV